MNVDTIIIIFLIYLHIAGAFLFFHALDTINGFNIKPLMRLPRVVRVVLLCLWPYFMIFWVFLGVLGGRKSG